MNNLPLFWNFKEFHPICGILRPSLSGILSISPFRIPSPSTPGVSSLRSNNNCKPRQIPRKGVPFAVTSLITSSSPYCLSLLIASPNAPTPGRITLSAFMIVSLSLVIVTSCPRSCMAFSTLFIFPAS